MFGLFQVQFLQLTHLHEVSVQVCEFYFFIPLVVFDNCCKEVVKVVVKSLEQLYCLQPPELLDKYVIEGFTLAVWANAVESRLAASRRLLLVGVALKHNDEEFTIVCLRDLSEQLDPGNCPHLYL